MKKCAYSTDTRELGTNHERQTGGGGGGGEMEEQMKGLFTRIQNLSWERRDENSECGCQHHRAINQQFLCFPGSKVTNTP